MKKILIAVLLGCFLLSGCQNKSEDPGIIARVNGKPIYLAQLEYKYDLTHEGNGGFVPSVEQVRAEYGQILGDLIVQELVSQELEEREIPVSDKEMKEAEDEVRSDYPDDSFEQILIEEYIDINAWRSQLKYQLAMDKFYSDILRPEIKIDYKEAEQYYRTHLSDFYMPAGFRFVMIKGLSKDLVLKGVELYREGLSPAAISAKLRKVSVQEIWIRSGQVPAGWKTFVENLEAGEATSVITQKKEFLCLILKEKKKATLLTPLQAYPMVEKVLLEKMLQEKFEAWLKNKMATSKIKISKDLLPEIENSGPDTDPQEAAKVE
ncbi:SurA N-terminal domain-containing protein [Desulfovibrio sp. JC010]|uniref:SurA N-terminal domain-containing protein n=1 Tax=Desulfovibrio sp. JC010 TaxID=2593641 RepID=UPI0013D696DF|nr:SurA N-terminal domain-containing protein [Desulfovibrio sp. JC010]NDV27991.1 peptidyl-prolyl cis-trans isomerase [Desulfovibrio sp. JC010]